MSLITCPKCWELNDISQVECRRCGHDMRENVQRSGQPQAEMMVPPDSLDAPPTWEDQKQTNETVLSAPGSRTTEPVQNDLSDLFQRLRAIPYKEVPAVDSKFWLLWAATHLVWPILLFIASRSSSGFLSDVIAASIIGGAQAYLIEERTSAPVSRAAWSGATLVAHFSWINLLRVGGNLNETAAIVFVCSFFTFGQGALLGLAQWLPLRPRLNRSWRWPLWSALASAVASVGIFFVSSSPTIAFSIYWAVYGLIAGRLLANLLREMVAEQKAVPAAI